jgi:hypothetical protein
MMPTRWLVDPTTTSLLPPHATNATVVVVVIVVVVVAMMIVVSEARFLVRYRRHIVPLANAIPVGPPAPYRDYPDPSDRVNLLVRILDRIIERARDDFDFDDDDVDVDVDDGAGRRRRREKEAAYEFVESWFVRMRDDARHDAPYELFSGRLDAVTLDAGLGPPPPRMMRMMRMSSSSSGDSSVVGGENEVGDEVASGRRRTTMKTKIKATDGEDRLLRGNMDAFLSWAFFGTSRSALSSDASRALDGLYDALRERAGLTFGPGTNPNYVPRTFTLDAVNSLYRPMCAYAAVGLMRRGGCLLLRSLGFREYVCIRGLGYWHRPPDVDDDDVDDDDANGGRPFLFFHGIAPGGHAPYLPMIFLGLLRGPRLSYRRRHVFLFENDPISYAVSSDALSEEDTVHGVLEAMGRHLGDRDASNAATDRTRDLDVCGHSFGSCQLTWMIKCARIGDRIGSLLLLDPVSILLSDPDVVTNFLYEGRRDPSGECSGWTTRWMLRSFHRVKIRLAVSSEIFIESYLRRNFAWYVRCCLSLYRAQEPRVRTLSSFLTNLSRRFKGTTRNCGSRTSLAMLRSSSPWLSATRS